MVYWKIDDETIRCLIHEDEIDKMGFDLNLLKSGDRPALESFVQAIISDSHNYIEWNTENGIQNFSAHALPSAQYLITISCTDREEAIDRDLEQIRRMIRSLKLSIPEERLTEIENLNGPEKENAFLALSKELHSMCKGKLAEELKKMKPSQAPQEENKTEEAIQQQEESPVMEQEEDRVLPSQKITFHSLKDVMEFCSLLDSKMNFDSQLYRLHEEYILLVDFTEFDDKVDIITMMITAEEFGASCQIQGLSRYYLMEHGQLLIDANAIGILKTFS